MKLLGARVQNFKLLRNIEFRFSANSKKPLTIIRGENASGKTSTHQALKWALFGNQALQDPTIRLSPADWPDGTVCPISVEIDMVHTVTSTVDDTLLTEQTVYMLKRQVEEVPDGDQPNRGQEKLSLYQKTDSGAESIRTPEIEVASMLPEEMSSVFFTDGDDAMTFISSHFTQQTKQTKQTKVREAIKHLLGLEMLEKTAKRLNSVYSNINRDISKHTSSQELAKVIDKLESSTEENDSLTQALTDIDHQIILNSERIRDTDRDLRRALEAGNHKQLSEERDRWETQLKRVEEENENCKREHQKLLQSEALSWGLVGSTLNKGYSLLERLNAQGIIPGSSIPVLQHCLELAQCICGTDLSHGTDGHRQVTKLIEETREREAHLDILSELYYQAKGEITKYDTTKGCIWKEFTTDLSKRRLDVHDRIREANKAKISVQARLELIDEAQIEHLEQQLSMLRSSQDRLNERRFKAHADKKDVEEKLKDLKKEHTRLLRLEQQTSRLRAQLTVAEDLKQIVEGTLNEMQGFYLNKVSQQMNLLFLGMAGVDPEQGSIFQGAEITKQYDIVVNSQDGKTLDTDYEVNGANQRALTFAFIWALTEVSGVVAPRIIDTPLGMMSGNVKRRVLEIISQPVDEEVDRQVLLFLTQSEISHTEDILDRAVGASMTLTRTDDYPINLVHDPQVSPPEIRLCHCTHREFCDLCQRNDSADFNLQYRSRKSVR